MGTAIKHPMPGRVKPSFVISDFRALWRSVLSVRVPGCGTTGRQRVNSSHVTAVRAAATVHSWWPRAAMKTFVSGTWTTTARYFASACLTCTATPSLSPSTARASSVVSSQWPVVSGQYSVQSVVSIIIVMRVSPWSVCTDDRRMCCRTLAVSPFACLVPHTATGALGVLGVRGRVYNT